MLREAIEQIRIIDTHEHLEKEPRWVEQGPDALGALFDNYVLHDIVAAGVPGEAASRAVKEPGDVGERFAVIAGGWARAQHTGYGEAVRLAAKAVYGIDHIDAAALEGAAAKHAELRRPGGRLALLRDTAGLECVQVDDFAWSCDPDPSGPEFFFYDISMVNWARGDLEPQKLHERTGIELKRLDDVRAGIDAVVARYAPTAIAIKTQHAYQRTLEWRERSDDEVAPIFARYLQAPGELNPAERLALGDWCLARVVEASIEHNLPVKIHTGYMAGNDRMQVDGTRARHLSPLLARYPKARFVLMHISYPYQHELLAIAKHYANVYIDLCWAWSIDPRASMLFLRDFIHTAPSHKLLGFGGDTFWPVLSVGYALQARRWLARALEAEMAAGDLSEAQAVALAQALLHDNAAALFDHERAVAGIRAAQAGGAAKGEAV